MAFKKVLDASLSWGWDGVLGCRARVYQYVARSGGVNGWCGVLFLLIICLYLYFFDDFFFQNQLLAWFAGFFFLCAICGLSDA